MIPFLHHLVIVKIYEASMVLKKYRAMVFHFKIVKMIGKHGFFFTFF